MAKKSIQQKMEEVEFEIDKDATKGPFKCHGKETRLIEKKISIDNNIFSYTVWQCEICKKEYLDKEQSKNLESIWTFEKLVRDDIISMKRALNYDGKMFFLRFPKELASNFHKGDHAVIKMIDTRRFVVEIRD